MCQISTRVTKISLGTPIFKIIFLKSGNPWHINQSCAVHWGRTVCIVLLIVSLVYFWGYFYENIFMRIPISTLGEGVSREEFWPNHSPFLANPLKILLFRCLFDTPWWGNFLFFLKIGTWANNCCQSFFFLYFISLSYLSLIVILPLSLQTVFCLASWYMPCDFWMKAGFVALNNKNWGTQAFSVSIYINLARAWAAFTVCCNNRH